MENSFHHQPQALPLDTAVAIQLLDLFRRHEPWYTLSIYNNVTLKQ